MQHQQLKQHLQNQTFQQLLKSYGFDETQVDSSLDSIQDIIEQEVLSDVVTSLSEHELKVLNSLKTQSAIDHFLKEKLPNLNEQIDEKISQFKQDIVSEIAKIEADLPQQPKTVAASQKTLVKPAPEKVPEKETAAAKPPGKAMETQQTAVDVPSASVAVPAEASEQPQQPMVEPPVSPAAAAPLRVTEPPKPDMLPAPSAPVLAEESAEPPKLNKQLGTAAPVGDLTTAIADDAKTDSYKPVDKPEPPKPKADLKSKWQELLKPPKPGDKKAKAPTAKGAKKKSSLPPLPPLPPLPGAGGKGGASPFGGGGMGASPFGAPGAGAKDKKAEKKKRKEESDKKRAELVKMTADREAKDKVKIDQLKQELAQIAQEEKSSGDAVKSIVASIDTDEARSDPMEHLPNNINRLRKMLKKSSSRGEWQLANDIMKKIKLLT